MSWLQPTPFEQDLVSDVRRRWPEIVPLARLLSLATRIEPLLLRNARLQFIPGSATEIESLALVQPADRRAQQRRGDPACGRSAPPGQPNCAPPISRRSTR
jgi:hypothetical protein